MTEGEKKSGGAIIPFLLLMMEMIDEENLWSKNDTQTLDFCKYFIKIII
jgi:hypothetical protein